MRYRAGDVVEALAIAERLRESGSANWFRGQVRNWPLLSSLARLEGQARDGAIEQLGRFHAWLGDAGLSSLAADVDALLVVAQHYGLATNLVDFTTEPRVAAFFALHDPPDHDPQAVSCIICLDTEELREVCEALLVANPDHPAPEPIAATVDGLWRLEAQRGVSLYYPYDEVFEREIFGFDRIVFPAARSERILDGVVPVEDIYPPQKSELEILLDRFFMAEILAEDRLKDLKDIARVVSIETPPDGIEAECFESGHLPVHLSWEESQLGGWLAPVAEGWQPMSQAERVTIDVPAGIDPPAQIEAVAAQVLEAAGHRLDQPIRWAVAAHDEEVAEGVSLIWDGLRRWPFAVEDVARGVGFAAVLGALVAAEPRARHLMHLAEALAERCLGDPVEVEIGMADNTYTRGYASGERLTWALRPDFGDYLTEVWRPQIRTGYQAIQVARVPSRVFVFERLASVFAREVAPTQVVLRGLGTGKARLFNPAQAVAIGLP